LAYISLKPAQTAMLFRLGSVRREKFVARKIASFYLPTANIPLKPTQSAMLFRLGSVHTKKFVAGEISST
jgi:hypothetical protein